MRRLKLIALVFAAALAAVALFAAVARADDRAVPVVTPQAASHDARIEGNAVTWRSTYAAFDRPYLAEASVRIDLALPFSGTLEPQPGVSAVGDKDTVVALVVDTARLPAWRDAVVARFRSTPSVAGDDLVLRPPLAAGEEIQRVDVASDDDRRFVPDPSAALVHDVGYWTASGVTDEARRACDRRIGDRVPAIEDVTLYVESRSAAVEHGLRGRALTGAERARPGMLGAVLLFLVLAGALAALYPWLTRHARVEQAEAILREEFDSVGRRGK